MKFRPSGWSTNQSPTGTVARPGTNTALLYDSEAYLLDSNGAYIEGRLPTDRPHVFKAYGSYSFAWGTDGQRQFLHWQRNTVYHDGRKHLVGIL